MCSVFMLILFSVYLLFVLKNFSATRLCVTAVIKCKNGVIDEFISSAVDVGNFRRHLHRLYPSQETGDR